MKRNRNLELARRIAISFLGLVAAFPAVALCQGNAAPELVKANPAATKMYATAANAQNAKQYKFAAEKWEEFLAAFPNTDITPKAQYYAGVCYMQLGDYTNAVKHYDIAATKWAKVPDFSYTQDSLLNLGWCQYTLGKKAESKDAANTLYDKADKALGELIKQFADGKYTDQALYFQGEALYWQGKKQESIAPYTKLVKDEKHKASSQRANGMYALGVTHEELEQYKEAGEIYDLYVQDFADQPLATEIKMRKAETILQIGLATDKDGKPAEAKALYEDALKRFATVEKVDGFNQIDQTIYRQGLCQSRLGNYEDAAKLYARVATEFPNFASIDSARLDAGRNFYSAKNNDEATKWFEDVIAKDAGNAPEAAHWICRINIRQGEFDKAVQRATAALSSAGESKFLVDLKMDKADALYEIPARLAEALVEFEAIAKNHDDHPQAPQALYNAAFTAMRLREFEKANGHVATFITSHAAHERLPDVKFVKAECQLLDNKPAEAEATYKDLIANHKGHPQFDRWNVRLGESLLAQEKCDDAITSLSAAIAAFKGPVDIAEGQFLIGKCQAKLEKHPEACTAFAASWAADAKWIQADETLLLWSVSLHKSDKTPDAIAKAKQLVAEFKESKVLDQAHYRLGEYSYASKDYEAAATEYASVIDNWPDSRFAPFALYNQGWALMDQSKFDTATGSFTALLEKHAAHSLAADAQFARGMCRRQTKDYEGAITDLAAFIKTEPKKVDACNALYEKGLAEVSLKKFKEAVKSFADVLALDAKCNVADKAMYEMAWAYKSDENGDEALKAFRQLMKDFPDSKLAAEAHFHDGEDLYGKGEYESAAATYAQSKAKAAQGSLQEKAIYKLGWSFYQQETFDKALVEFKQQIETYPEGVLYGDGIFMVGESQFKLKKYDEALPAFVKALAAVKDNAKTPDEVKVLIHLHGGQSAVALDKWTEALALLQPIPTNFKDSLLIHEAQFEIGRSHEGLGKDDDAITAYDLAAASPGEIGFRANYMIGRIHFKRKEFDQAVKKYKEVVFGAGPDAPEEVKKWQAYSGYETARCNEARIVGAQEPQRTTFIKEAKEFYNYVVTNHPTNTLAAEAKKRLVELAKLK